MRVIETNNQWVLEDDTGIRFIFNSENDMWEFLLKEEAA